MKFKYKLIDNPYPNDQWARDSYWWQDEYGAKASCQKKYFLAEGFPMNVEPPEDYSSDEKDLMLAEEANESTPVGDIRSRGETT